MLVSCIMLYGYSIVQDRDLLPKLYPGDESSPPPSPPPPPDCVASVVRWGLLLVVRQISGDDTGAPSRGVVILCLLLTLVSAWITDFIGIDAIFGAFVAGIIVPREHR